MQVTGEKAAQLRLESTANNFFERLEKSRDAAGDSSRVAFALVVLLNTVVVVGGAFVGTWYLVPYATAEFVRFWSDQLQKLGQVSHFKVFIVSRLPVKI